ncbi:hypothetical protein G4B88_028942 [Cannabis sativa]|uniref:Uncharacterized protein n=1 Tax=Cannabis sativa TaxID=3483 RepID=A0A7J6HPH3_CANSA|nr:hypothetical protein G4B88_028942 [Cannabis sativa]
MDDESDELFVTNINHSLKPTPTPSSTSTAPRRGMKKLGLGKSGMLISCIRNPKVSVSSSSEGIIINRVDFAMSFFIEDASSYVVDSDSDYGQFKTISPIAHPSSEAVSLLMSPDMGQHGIGGLGFIVKMGFGFRL